MSRKRLTRLLSSLRPAEASRRGLPETLTAAAAQGDLPSMEAFLARDANLAERTPGFASPLVAACTAGRLEAVRFLLGRGADLRPKEAVVTPVQAAVMNGHVEVLKALLEAGATLDEAAAGLPGACASGFFPMVELLISSGLNLDQARAEGRSVRERATDAARLAGRRAIVSYLRDQKVDPEEVRSSPTALDERRSLQARLQKDRGEAPRASAEERPQRIQEALEALHSAGEGAAAWTTDDGEPLLAVASGHGLREIVEALLAVGADPGAAAAHSLVTPLIRAAEGGHREIARVLVSRGANPTALDAEGRSALHAAAEYGDPELVKMLLQAGADPKARSTDGRSPKDRALGPFAREVLELLPKEAALAETRGKVPRRKAR